MTAIYPKAFLNALSWIANFCILIRFSLKFVPKGPVDNMSSLVQVMVWRQTGNKKLSEPMLAEPNHSLIYTTLGKDE